MTRKELLLRAIKRAEETIETCSRPSKPGKDPVNDEKIRIAMIECVALAKGRKQAFEAVLDAMNGGKRLLGYYALEG